MSAVKRWFNSLYRTILLGLYLPLANYLVSFTHLTCLGFSPTHVHEFLLRWSQHRSLWAHVHTYYGVVSPEACGHMSTRTMGWCLLPLEPPRRPPVPVQSWKLPLTSGVSSLPHLSSFSSVFLSRALLLPLALSLECLGEKKPQFYSAWQTPASQPRGASTSCLRMTSTWLSLQQNGPLTCLWTRSPLSQFTPRRFFSVIFLIFQKYG